MKLIININEDIVTVRYGTYEVVTKADIPDDPKDALEYLYEEHIIDELLRELTHEIY